MVTRSEVANWVGRYERSWRSAGTGHLAELFSPDVTYRPSPWSEALVDLDELGAFWERERDGPDEPFEMVSEVVAVDGDRAVVRVAVEYELDDTRHWRDLWVLEFDPDGRCTSFEEWPFAPDQDDGNDVT